MRAAPRAAPTVPSFISERASSCPKGACAMGDDNSRITQSGAMQRIIAEDAVGQLRRHDGLMATLGSENGSLKLDWVEGIARLLADPAQLEEVEAEARDIWQRGIRHIIWDGMGGSVLTVRVLCELGFCGDQDKD